MKIIRFALIIWLLIFNVCCCVAQPKPQAITETEIKKFLAEINVLQKKLKIPAISVGVVQNGKTILSSGYGFANYEKKIKATELTLYHIASLTKTFSANLILRLIAQRKISLDDPIKKYASDFPDSLAKVKHILSHTSSGTPGSNFEYDGNRYYYLTKILEAEFKMPICEIFEQEIIKPLGLTNTFCSQEYLETNFPDKIKLLAQPYTIYNASEIIHVPFPPKDVNSSAGIISCITDLIRYDSAVSVGFFADSVYRELAWRNFLSNTGQMLPHGLGWFVEDLCGNKVVWHFGHFGTGYSSAYVKFIPLGITVIFLSNSESLSEGFFGDEWKIENSPFVCAFIRACVKKITCLSCLQKSNHLADLRLANNVKASFRSIKVNYTYLKKFTGNYFYKGNSRTYTVIFKNHRLFIDMPRFFFSEMFPVAENVFRLKTSMKHILKFSFSKKTGDCKLIIEYGNQTFIAEKIQ